MPTSAEVLFDTSASVALLLRSHPTHAEVRTTSEGRVRGLAGHAVFETYSVLTRLPGDLRLDASRARRAIERAFPASVGLPASDPLRTLQTLADAGVAGAAVYDGLVGLAARGAGVPLLTCDRRAVATYAALGVEVELV